MYWVHCQNVHIEYSKKMSILVPSVSCMLNICFFMSSKSYTCMSNRIFSPLILFIKMFLTAFYFILFTFTNGEEGKVSSKKNIDFCISIYYYSYHGCSVFYSIRSIPYGNGSELLSCGSCQVIVSSILWPVWVSHSKRPLHA